MKIFPAVPTLLALAASCPAATQGHAFELRAIAGMAGDEFGNSVAIDADSILVGSWQSGTHGVSSGTAYIFDSKTGVQVAQLASNNPAAFDTFGYDVAIQGDRAVVSSPFSLYGGATVFVRAAGVWAQEVRLSAFDGAPFDNFGYSVALDGDTVAIGSFRDDDNGDSSGSVYVYRRDVCGWNLEAKLIPSDGQQNGWFGNDLALEGETLLVGAPGGNSATTLHMGVGYIFERSGSTWIERAKLAPAAGQVMDFIGYSVDLHGGLAVLGAPSSDASGNDTGAAYTFEKSGNVWAEHAMLLPATNSAEGHFGLSVATDGLRILVGAHGQNAQGLGSGAAYEFLPGGGQWTEHRRLLPGDGVAGDNFGVAVALLDDVAVIGANWTGDQGDRSGSAYHFDLSPPGRGYCFGDGGGAPCPCGGLGSADSGCANTSHSSGGRLSASGAPSLVVDEFRLHVAGLPDATPGLVLQGADQVAGGQGLPAGDGLLCTTGRVMRSQIQSSVAGAMTFEHMHGVTFGQASYGSGAPAHYQVMYRDFANPCSGLMFNLTNAWTVAWTP